jgi:hypothetical protein
MNESDALTKKCPHYSIATAVGCVVVAIAGHKDLDGLGDALMIMQDKGTSLCQGTACMMWQPWTEAVDLTNGKPVPRGTCGLITKSGQWDDD